jgi:hypothetical protein
MVKAIRSESPSLEVGPLLKKSHSPKTGRFAWAANKITEAVQCVIQHSEAIVAIGTGVAIGYLVLTSTL